MRSTMYFFEQCKYFAPPTRFVDPTTKIYTPMFAAPLLKHNSCFKSQDVLASSDSLLKLWDCLWWMMRSQVTLWRKQYTCRVWFTSSTDLSPPLFRHINACHKLACWLANTFYHSIYRRSGCKGFDPCESKKVFSSLWLWVVLVSEIFEEVLEVDGGEVGVDEGEDDPVRVAQLLHHLLHLQAQVAFASC